MKCTIKAIAYELPQRIVDNDELHRENPAWEMARVEARAGVLRRHIARDDETALDLSIAACEKLFAEHPQAKADVDAIVYCTQSPDHVMPPNSCLLHGKLGLSESVLAFDFTLACSGFIYGLAISRGLLLSGAAGNVLLVTADTYSKYIHPGDRGARVLFGDAAAVTWLGLSAAGDGISDIQCATSGKDGGKFMIPAGGSRLPRSEKTGQPVTDRSGNVRTPEHIHMDGLGVLSFFNSRVPGHVRGILERNQLTVADVDLFVFHQASKVVLDYIIGALKIPPEKAPCNLRDIGNTVSASIPIALKDAMDHGQASPGQTVLLCGFGVGLSWGSAILEL